MDVNSPRHHHHLILLQGESTSLVDSEAEEEFPFRLIVGEKGMTALDVQFHHRKRAYRSMSVSPGDQHTVSRRS